MSPLPTFRKTYQSFIYHVEYTVVNKRDGSEKRYSREMPGADMESLRAELREDINRHDCKATRACIRTNRITQRRERRVYPYRVKDIVITRLGAIKRGG
jgi:hypothetical protein